MPVSTLKSFLSPIRPVGFYSNIAGAVSTLAILGSLVFPVDETASFSGVAALFIFCFIPYAAHALILYLARKNVFASAVAGTGSFISALIGIVVYIDALIIKKSLLNFLVLLSIPGLQLGVAAIAGLCVWIICMASGGKTDETSSV